MTPATVANKYSNNIGHDFTMLDAEYMDAEAEEVDETERQRVNAVMFDYFFG
jgi:hypothetical protein